MTVTSPVSTTAPAAAPANGTIADDPMIASNFTTFLQLLTTQLQNQDPTSPMDTNQFTQQLVMFAQVEQQIKSNDELSTLVALQQSAQATAALSYVGSTVVVDGSSTQLVNSSATWNLSVGKPATATVTITDVNGQIVYTGSRALSPGTQQFEWNGLTNTGQQLPDGTYRLTATAVDAGNQPVSVSSEVQGKVDSADLTQNPPVLSINGENFTLDKIKRIVSVN
jgi:flagellar basal-body rod modification protein FlgD